MSRDYAQALKNNRASLSDEELIRRALNIVMLVKNGVKKELTLSEYINELEYRGLNSSVILGIES